jgi:hypothetical protein
MKPFRSHSPRRRAGGLHFAGVLKKPIGRPRSFWEHPLTLLIVGFLLSGVLGTGISFSIQSEQARAEAKRQEAEAQRERDVRHYEASMRAVIDFSNSLYARYVRAGMLKSAIQRHDSADEIKRRKFLYDEALVQQESQMLGNLLLIREALKEQDYDKWENEYEYALKPRLSALDSELTDLTDESLASKFRSEGRTARLLCVNELYVQVRTCDSAIVNAVFSSLSAKQYLSGTIVIDSQRKAEADVEAHCPSPEIVPLCNSATGAVRLH